jgi:transposase-like protein
MMYVRFPLSPRNVEDPLFEPGFDTCHETVKLWCNRFGPLFAGDGSAACAASGIDDGISTRCT